MSEDMNDTYYDTIGLDGELRTSLRRSLRDARTFATAVATGIKPLDIQVLTQSLITNLTTLRDLLALRYGTPHYMAKEDEPIEVEDFIDPNEARLLGQMLTNVEKEAQRTIEEGTDGTG